jgi:hypothetical protein
VKNKRSYGGYLRKLLAHASFDGQILIQSSRTLQIHKENTLYNSINSDINITENDLCLENIPI